MKRPCAARNYALLRSVPGSQGIAGVKIAIHLRFLLRALTRHVFTYSGDFMAEQQAVLLLDDGTCFPGLACGARGEATGEVVFATGMTGYQETLTDPSYHGQIISFTTAHIGNYGAVGLDDEASRVWAGGAVFHDYFLPEQEAPFPHWRAGESLDARLARDGITGIYGVDTRSLTLHLRKNGARNGIISALDRDIPSLLRRAKALPPIMGRDLAREVTCAAPYACANDVQPPRFRVAVYDFGVKRSILDGLAKAGLEPFVWPATTPAEEVLASQPDGVFFSNGPGDPEPCTYAVAAAKKLLGTVPLFGICLGHQIIGLALGAKTYKLSFGHHGVNHPVKDIASGRVWITSQNHGFCVDPDTLPPSVTPSHWNLNDNTLEGMVCEHLPAFSVQFHPEAGPGPYDAAGLFARFRDMISTHRQQC